MTFNKYNLSQLDFYPNHKEHFETTTLIAYRIVSRTSTLIPQLIKHRLYNNMLIWHGPLFHHLWPLRHTLLLLLLIKSSWLLRLAVSRRIQGLRVENRLLLLLLPETCRI